jgi:CRP/FNR family transcriptional regulator
MHIIVEGRVRVSRSHAELLQPVVLAELGPGEIVGEMGLLDNEPRVATVTAIADTLTLELSDSALCLTLLQFPEVIPSLLSTLSRRLRNTDALLQEITRQNPN